MFTSDRATRLANNALKSLGESLAAGKSDTLKTFLKAMSQFHRYSWHNAMLIQWQRPDSTQVAGYGQWLKLGRHVRRGENGITILVPLRCAPKRDQESGKIEEALVGFTTGHVFDISQTDGPPLPGFAKVKGNPSCYLEKLKSYILQKDIKLEYAKDLGGALGVSKGGSICLKEDSDPAEEFTTLAHELAHELMHRGDRRPTKQVRELEAEAVAFVLSTGIGLENESASADYVHLYGGDEKKLADSLQHIHKVAVGALNAILE